MMFNSEKKLCRFGLNQSIMKATTLVFMLMAPSLIYAQTIYVPMVNNGAKTYKVETDTSTIEVNTFERANSIRQFNKLKNKDVSYYKDFYLDTKSVREAGAFVNSYSSGIWKMYAKNGKLISVIDHDKGTWTVMNKSIFPYYELRMRMKRKADSLVKSVYGKEFFEKNVVFSLDGSDWTREISTTGTIYALSEKPTRFMMRYSIKFDKEHTYPEMIEFELDENGNYIPDQYENIYGFEKLPANDKHIFKLTYNNAIEQAKQKGLVETDTAKTIAFLHWESFKTPQLYNGNYKFCVLQRTNTTVDNKNGRTVRTDFFKVWEFNPWSGEFVRIKQMKRVNSRERDGGYDTGFLDVK
jgi:hypothetical protein